MLLNVRSSYNLIKVIKPASQFTTKWKGKRTIFFQNLWLLFERVNIRYLHKMFHEGVNGVIESLEAEESKIQAKPERIFSCYVFKWKMERKKEKYFM